MIEISGVHKAYGQFEVVKGVDLRVDKGEVLSIIGGSGSGKSTFLRCLNGLEEFDEGSVSIDGVDLADPRTDINAYRREVGMVFQHFNLWSHMSALENVIEAPVHVLGVSKKEAIEKAEHYLAKVGVAHRKDAYPAHMSGGEQQRVAIARALAVEPEVMLFDEPT
ncbi:amino acid ABC transporter ATP-binding protein, partial [Klebsiella pneumoniae]